MTSFCRFRRLSSPACHTQTHRVSSHLTDQADNIQVEFLMRDVRVTCHCDTRLVLATTLTNTLITYLHQSMRGRKCLEVDDTIRGTANLHSFSSKCTFSFHRYITQHTHPRSSEELRENIALTAPGVKPGNPSLVSRSARFAG